MTPSDEENPAEPDTAPAPAASSPPPREKASDEARIAKVMARAGLCSRRDAEAWIRDGRVAINGVALDSPARNVGPDDAITVDGYPIDKPERTRLFLFHKTRGLVTTAKDPEGRPTVFDALPEELPRLVTIGRLDINTEGLLLLTNDGGLARLLELPSTGWIRRYRVRANGTIDQGQLDALAKGITIEGIEYAGIAAKLDRVQGANLWLTMGLKEGKNREIKRVLEYLGLAVTRLIRVSFGPFQLGDLIENGVEEVRTRVLRDQLGSALARQAGVDFDGPVAAGRPAPAEAPEVAPSGRPRPPRGADTPRPQSASRRAVPEAPRRQTRRGTTQDRRGRPVSVERIASAKPERTAGPRPRTVRQADRAAGDTDETRGTGQGFGPRRARSADRPSAPRADGGRHEASREGKARARAPNGVHRGRPDRATDRTRHEGSSETRVRERPSRRDQDRDRPPRASPAPRRDSDRPKGGGPRTGGPRGGKGGGKTRPRG